MKRKLNYREQYELIRWLPRAMARASILDVDQVPKGFTPDMAFLAFGFTGSTYNKRTRIMMERLAMTPTQDVKWFDAFAAKFRLEATCSEIGRRP